MQNMLRNPLEKYAFHKTLFQITDSLQLSIFEKHLFSEAIPFSLECSCKLDNCTVFPERFNMWYKDSKYFHDVVKRTVSFFKELSQKGNFRIDLPKFKKIILDIDYNNVAQIIVGVDFRKNFSDSRAKLWFIVRGDQKRISDVLTQYDSEVRVQAKSSIISDVLLYGFDFYPSGRIDTKIYPLYYEKDIPFLLEKGLIQNSEKLLDLLTQTNSFHISFKNTTSDKIYHMRPKYPDVFVSGLGNDLLLSLCSKISESPSKNTTIISISEKELILGKIISANIYY